MKWRICLTKSQTLFGTLPAATVINGKRDHINTTVRRRVTKVLGIEIIFAKVLFQELEIPIPASLLEKLTGIKPDT